MSSRVTAAHLQDRSRHSCVSSSCSDNNNHCRHVSNMSVVPSSLFFLRLCPTACRPPTVIALPENCNRTTTETFRPIPLLSFLRRSQLGDLRLTSLFGLAFGKIGLDFSHLFSFCLPLAACCRRLESCISDATDEMQLDSRRHYFPRVG